MSEIMKIKLHRFTGKLPALIMESVNSFYTKTWQLNILYLTSFYILAEK